MLFDDDIRARLIALSLQSSAIYLIYYGLTSSVQDLGLKSIQFNGILISLTSLIGIAFVGVYGSVLPRKKSTLVCLLLEILGGVILLILSKASDSIECKAIQSLISTFWMNTVVSAHMNLLYFQNNECFPTSVKGKAIACILLVGKLRDRKSVV